MDHTIQLQAKPTNPTNQGSTPLPTPLQRCVASQNVAEAWLKSTDGLLAKVRRALMSDNAEAVQGVVEAVRFLSLVASDRSRDWTPSHRVDLVWHEMILFTRSYSHFCRLEFGDFIHHQPSDDHGKNQRAFASTLSAYRDWFGDPDARFWGTRNQALATCGPCDAGG